MSRRNHRHIAVLGAQNDREVEAILKSRGFHGPAIELIQRLVQGYKSDDEIVFLSEADSPKLDEKLEARARAQLAYVEGALRERLRMGALRIAKEYDYNEKSVPIAALFLVMADKLVERPDRLPPRGSGSTVFRITESGTTPEVPSDAEIIAKEDDSFLHLPEFGGQLGDSMYSWRFWYGINSEKRQVWLPDKSAPERFDILHMSGFSRSRAGTAYPHAMRDWAKPGLFVTPQQLYFNLSKHLGGPDTPSVDVTRMVPLTWRFAIAQRALEHFADLRTTSWFIPEGDARTWSDFFLTSVVEPLRKSGDALYAEEDETLMYQRCVGFMTAMLECEPVKVELSPGHAIDPSDLLPNEYDVLGWNADAVERRRSGTIRRLA